MPKRLKILQPHFQNWGFADAWDYIYTVLGMKGVAVIPMSAQLLATVGAGFIMFLGNYVWSPVGALGLIVAVELANAYYGYQVSKQIKGVGFNLVKFSKTRSMIISDIVLLAMLHNAVTIYPEGTFLKNVLFWWLFQDRALATLKHMVDLKLQSGKLAHFLRSFIMNRLKSKIGADIVDNIQDHPHKKDDDQVII